MGKKRLLTFFSKSNVPSPKFLDDQAQNFWLKKILLWKNLILVRNIAILNQNRLSIGSFFLHMIKIFANGNLLLNSSLLYYFWKVIPLCISKIFHKFSSPKSISFIFCMILIHLVVLHMNNLIRTDVNWCLLEKSWKFT